MIKHCLGWTPELAFNSDEVGARDREDRRQTIVITTVEVAEHEDFDRFSVGVRYLKFLACVTAAGHSLASIVMASSPVLNDTWLCGLRQDGASCCGSVQDKGKLNIQPILPLCPQQQVIEVISSQLPILRFVLRERHFRLAEWKPSIKDN
jgi:hypothetical protein